MSGTALIVTAVVVFVVLVSAQAFRDWPLAGLGGGGDESASTVSGTAGAPGADRPGGAAGPGSGGGQAAGAGSASKNGAPSTSQVDVGGPGKGTVAGGGTGGGGWDRRRLPALRGQLDGDSGSRLWRRGLRWRRVKRLWRKSARVKRRS